MVEQLCYKFMKILDVVKSGTSFAFQQLRWDTMRHVMEYMKVLDIVNWAPLSCRSLATLKKRRHFQTSTDSESDVVPRYSDL